MVVDNWKNEEIIAVAAMIIAQPIKYIVIRISGNLEILGLVKNDCLNLIFGTIFTPFRYNFM